MFLKPALHVLALMALSASALLVWLRSRRAGGAPWKALLAMQASLLCFVLSLSLHGLIGPREGSAAGLIADFLGFAGAAGCVAAARAILRRCFLAPRRLFIDLAYLVALGLCALAYAWSFLRREALLLGAVLQFLALGHLAIEGRRRFSACADPLLASVFAWTARIALPAAPFLVLDPLGSILGWTGLGFLVDDYALPLFFLGLNLVISWRVATGVLDTEGERPIQSAPDFSAQGLSPQEVRIALALLRGLSAKAIAGELGLAPKTVENHTYRLFGKLGVSGRYEFICAFGGVRGASGLKPSLEDTSAGSPPEST